MFVVKINVVVCSEFNWLTNESFGVMFFRCKNKIKHMNIYKYADFMKQESCGHSYSFLAERVPTSDEAPHRIAVVKESIKADDAVVLALGGSGDGANIIGHNWFIKYITNFIRNNENLNHARVCVAVCDMSEKYMGNTARTVYNIKKSRPFIWRLLKDVGKHPITKMDSENYQPHAVKDIFNNVFLPKLIDKNGSRFQTNQMLKNIRGVTIIAYCAGGHTAMYLEEEIKSRMSEMGYTHQEIRMALNQIPVLGYAMNCPIQKSDLRFISFNSVADGCLESFTPIFNRYLYITSADFGVMHSKQGISDSFVCTKISNTGIEGNPNIVYAMPIEEYMEKQEEQNQESWQESEDDLYTEHKFLGFVAKKGYSNGAKNLQKLFKNVIINATENSIQNSKSDNFTPLPKTEDLVAPDVDVYGRANLAYMQERIPYVASAIVPWQMICKTRDIIWLHKLGRFLRTK